MKFSLLSEMTIMIKKYLFVFFTFSLSSLDPAIAKDGEWVVLKTEKIANGLVTIVKKSNDQNVFNLTKEPVKNFTDKKLAIRFACENMSKTVKVINYQFDIKDLSCSYQLGKNKIIQEIMIREKELIHITHEPAVKGKEITNELKSYIRKGHFI